MIKENFKRMRGKIELFSIDGETWTKVHEQHNLITYEGSDILAKALAGALNVNAMYLVFENDPAAIRISEDIANDASTYATASANRSF